MSAVAAFSSFIPLIVVASMRRAERNIHRRLADARAFSAESAIQMSPGRPFEGRRLQGLIHGGAVRKTADNLCFIDADGWNAYQLARRRRVTFVISVLGALIGIGVIVLCLTP